MTRVNVHDLVDEYPGYTFVTLQRKPFTGLGFETIARVSPSGDTSLATYHFPGDKSK
jgi:hypothetical protein